MQAQKRIVVILGSQRTGTTAIGGLLGKQLGVRYAGEIFHSVRGPQDEVGYRKYYTLAEVNFFAFRERMFGKFPALSYPSFENQRALWRAYKEFLYSHSTEPLWVLDIKYNSLHHLNPVWQNHLHWPGMLHLLAEDNVPILHMWREDVFAQAVSLARSMRLGAWHLLARDDGRPAEAIPINPRMIEDIMVHASRMVLHIKDMLRFYKWTSELEYSEAFDGQPSTITPSARKLITTLFDLSQPIAGDVEFAKMTNRDLMSLLPNAAEIRQHFQGHYLKDFVAKHLDATE